MKRNRLFYPILIFAFMTQMSAAQNPPLPFHTVEGNSGAFITPMAYLTNPPAEGKIFGLPSFSFSGAFIGEKDFQSYVVTENLFGFAEISFAAERIGLGDWPDEVFQATGGGLHVEDYAVMYNLNTRINVVKEGGYDCPWMPAITVGAHFKWNDQLNTIDDQLGGLCGNLGADHDFGTEFTAIASKTITEVLPRPLIVSGGIRNGDGIHTGLLGFAGERRTTFEGSLIYFLTDQLLIATEYRQKSDLIDQCSAGGYDLVRAENDWWDICFGYIVNDHITLAAGYANFGNILNHHEDNVWAFQLKYEF